MKKALTLVFVVFSGCLFAAQGFAQTASAAAQPTTAAGIQAETPAPAATEGGGAGLEIADFDTGDKPNNLGGDFGSWDKDPNDETQGTKLSFESNDALGDKTGYSVRLDYDVDSPNPAYNGFWMKLNALNATEYNTLNISVKGDGTKGFTPKIKLELKDASGTSPYILSGVTDQWQEFSIPFEKFRRITDWSALTEFVVVFDDINSNPKAGTVYIDNVRMSAE